MEDLGADCLGGHTSEPPTAPAGQGAVLEFALVPSVLRPRKAGLDELAVRGADAAKVGSRWGGPRVAAERFGLLQRCGVGVDVLAEHKMVQLVALTWDGDLGRDSEFRPARRHTAGVGRCHDLEKTIRLRWAILNPK